MMYIIFGLIALYTTFLFIYMVINHYLPEYKRSVSNSSFDELMKVLNVIVHTEIELYEKNIFNDKGSITPQNFENYYNDICNNIVSSLSPLFFKKMRQFISDEATVAYICRNVKDYLSEKVTGSI